MTCFKDRPGQPLAALRKGRLADHFAAKLLHVLAQAPAPRQGVVGQARPPARPSAPTAGSAAWARGSARIFVQLRGLEHLLEAGHKLVCIP